MKRLKAEVSKLRELQLSQKDSYESEVQGMKVEISRLTKDLHDRTKTMANLSEESSQIEAQLRTEVEAQDRRQAELQVCAKVCFFLTVFSLQSCTPISSPALKFIDKIIEKTFQILKTSTVSKIHEIT